MKVGGELKMMIYIWCTVRGYTSKVVHPERASVPPPKNKPAFVPMLTLRRCCLLRGDGRSEEANALQMVAMVTDPSSTQLAAASVIILHECFVRVRFGPVLQLPNMTHAEQFGCARHASLHSMVVSTQPGELLGLWEGELL